MQLFKNFLGSLFSMALFGLICAVLYWLFGRSETVGNVVIHFLR